jgi:hypothetical protein
LVTLTLDACSEGPLIPQQRRFELVALEVGCAPIAATRVSTRLGCGDLDAGVVETSAECDVGARIGRNQRRNCLSGRAGGQWVDIVEKVGQRFSLKK